MPDVTVTIPAERIPELVGYISDGSDLYDEHAFRVLRDEQRSGGLSPVEWAVLPALREHFAGESRRLVDEMLAWADAPAHLGADTRFDAAMERFIEKHVRDREFTWNAKADLGDEWEVAFWIDGDYAGTWRLTADADELLDADEVEVAS
jgi:hypothetical protein